MNIEIKILDKKFYAYDSGLVDDSNVGYDLPTYATAHSAGLDLRTTQSVGINPGDEATIQTGLALHIGSGGQNVVGLLAPRSSLGARGFVLQNTIGVIDADYQNEILIKAFNRGKHGMYLERGERIAQLLLIPILKADFNIVDEFSNHTERGIGGFGSTGQK